LGYKNRHPFSVGEPLASNTYTYEFKAKLLEPINPEVVPAWPIGVYSSDNVNRLNRSGAYYGRWAADNQIFLDKTGPSINGDNYMFGDVISPLVVGEWAVFRVVQDVAANTTKIWINSVLQLTAPSGAEGAEDDPLSFGGHNGGDTLVEWDYLRFVRGVLDIAEPLNAPGGGGCAGNLNGDGTTDGADVAIIYNAWGTNDATADIDDSGTVDGADLAQVFNCWGQADTSPAAVPEPASFGLLGLGLLGLLTRARR